MKRIAVEPNLSHLHSALEGRGYQVVPLHEDRTPPADAYVISGMDKNLTGVHDTNGRRAPVINADGLTADEVLQHLERGAAGQGP